MKRKCAEAAFGMIREGMTIGLGGGETIRYLIEFIHMSDLRVQVVTPSTQTALLAARHEIEVVPTWLCPRVDVAFDGCNEIDPELNCLKSLGAIHTQEKIIAAMADTFVILADETKLRQQLVFDHPLTIEVMKEAFSYVLGQLFEMGLHAAARQPQEKDGFVITDQGNIVIDVDFSNVADPIETNRQILGLCGVVDTSLFTGVVDKAIVATKDGVQVLEKPDRAK
ncbi:ribose 5-phosphate isomerase A [uncultured Dubosiella sp.]|uniref:ribose 5-phosphate isomerase A n=1 Tax=uncultured Dubosiella sp. TaxID=1937011 RepID=UPI0025B4CFE2|nr:ribose 5-phosphate isomerase A [uncultured Dubosiella sp.]